MNNRINNNFARTIRSSFNYIYHKLELYRFTSKLEIINYKFILLFVRKNEFMKIPLDEFEKSMCDYDDFSIIEKAKFYQAANKRQDIKSYESYADWLNNDISILENNSECKDYWKFDEDYLKLEIEYMLKSGKVP